MSKENGRSKNLNPIGKLTLYAGPCLPAGRLSGVFSCAITRCENTPATHYLIRFSFIWGEISQFNVNYGYDFKLF
jgi:hypothetical protein